MFKNSHRLGSFDYATVAAYYITICSHNRSLFFGEVKNGIVGLNHVGCVVAQELQKSEVIRKEVLLDNWIIMPNHIHMIVSIVAVDGVHPPSFSNDGTVPPLAGPGAYHAPLQRPKKSIPSFVAGFKSGVTRRLKETGYLSVDGSIWQPNYYDHIIRNQSSLNSIRDYILSNPRTWHEDEYLTSED